MISLLTFPGVIVHEMGHQLFCRILKIAVFDVCYFQVENPAGYVSHEIPNKEYKHLLITIAPFFFNSIVGALIAFPAAIQVFLIESGGFFDYFLIWLGVSIAMHAFPSTGDAASLWDVVNSSKTSLIFRLLGTPVVGLIYLGAMGSVLWLDLLYGIAVASFLPRLIVSFFAFL
ncbi:MAG: metalloprotease family protein [bacterium]